MKTCHRRRRIEDDEDACTSKLVAWEPLHVESDVRTSKLVAWEPPHVESGLGGRQQRDAGESSGAPAESHRVV